VSSLFHFKDIFAVLSFTFAKIKNCTSRLPHVKTFHKICVSIDVHVGRVKDVTQIRKSERYRNYVYFFESIDTFLKSRHPTTLYVNSLRELLELWNCSSISNFPKRTRRIFACTSFSVHPIVLPLDWNSSICWRYCYELALDGNRRKKNFIT
jgi:hypothetical protein